MKHKLSIFVLIFSIFIVLGCSQTPETNEIPSTEQIQEKQEISLWSSDDPVWGSEDAQIEMVIFSDFECNHCKDFMESIDQLSDDWISSGKMKIQFRDFFLAKHVNSLSAHVAAEAAHQQGKYLEMHHELYATQAEWTEIEEPQTFFASLAEKIGLDIEQYQTDYNSLTLINEVTEDRDEGRQLGVTGTPAFFINGEMYQGAMNFQKLLEVIRAKRV